LRQVERQLAAFVGPLARVLVEKAVSRAASIEELYAILAASLERKADREAFLARKAELNSKAELDKGWTSLDLSRESLQFTQDSLHLTTSLPSTSETPASLTPAEIERAARLLARHIGPIARVLAKRAAQRAESLAAFYVLLGEHVEDKTERSRFLRDAA
jgi:serine/threonine-protein kinase